MSSLLLDTPLFGEHKKSGLAVVVIAIDFSGSSTVALYSDSEGYLHVSDIEEIRTDWRYDSKKEVWFDQGVKAANGVADG